MNIFGINLTNKETRGCQELTGKIEELKELKIKVQPLLEQIKELEREVKQKVLSGAEFDEVAGIKVTVRDGYVRVSWDSKALDGYAVAHPELEKFRKTAEVGPTVAFKVEK